MYKGEINNMNLEEEELNKYKNSIEYKDIIKLYKEKFYLDYIKYINEKKES
jgi:hypothetical protein